MTRCHSGNIVLKLVYNLLFRSSAAALQKLAKDPRFIGGALAMITDLWKKDRVVHIKPIGDGSCALKYLAPYLYRVAITNNRTENLENGSVTFRFKNGIDNQWKKSTLPAVEFIHRFLQHVLPKGFVKIRYYGLFAPNKRNLLAIAKYLLGKLPESNLSDNPNKDRICPCCVDKLVWAMHLARSTRGPP